ncbi:hypothetical protein [Streptomyces endophytica]|uniref:GyrI-like small molecule binding domain-containing protein n=1 Tax=Streptomyces endophytica TaxID=2991496 RepID=A0ABY6P8S1_9ACTN|nr:hypothetical protein [Streptomyces endophytica]UZJ30218.1 hypothetical protein OJ254_07125 [Streptomyces endophytica]
MIVKVNTERVKTVAVTASLAAWLVATAAGQLPENRFDNLLRRGRWQIPVPNWRFFGPNPGVKDNHLLYRDIVDGEPGEWQEVPITRDRPWYALAWNARNRSPKALFDASQDTIGRSVAFGPELHLVTLGSGYRLLSRYIQRHLPHAEGASHSQFMLMQSFLKAPGDREIEPVFVSLQFPLNDHAAPGDATPEAAAFPVAA